MDKLKRVVIIIVAFFLCVVAALSYIGYRHNQELHERKLYKDEAVTLVKNTLTEVSNVEFARKTEEIRQHSKEANQKMLEQIAEQKAAEEEAARIAAEQAAAEEAARQAAAAKSYSYNNYDYNDYDYSEDSNESSEPSEPVEVNAGSGSVAAQDPSHFKRDGVIYDEHGTRYTWYSSNVLHHYRTEEWTPNENGFYTTSEGNLVVASEDYPEGTIIDTPYGQAQVLDNGCDNGTVDFYTNF